MMTIRINVKKGWATLKYERVGNHYYSNYIPYINQCVVYKGQKHAVVGWDKTNSCDVSKYEAPPTRSFA